MAQCDDHRLAEPRRRPGKLGDVGFSESKGGYSGSGNSHDFGCDWITLFYLALHRRQIRAEQDTGTKYAEQDTGTKCAEQDIGTGYAEQDTGTRCAEQDTGKERAEQEPDS